MAKSQCSKACLPSADQSDDKIGAAQEVPLGMGSVARWVASVQPQADCSGWSPGM